MNKNKSISVFISYRRSSGREIARNLYERMSMNGINTFFDYNSMRNGKFNEQIYTAIEQADDFILILNKDTLDRCVNADDWVRIEIEHAIKFNKNIILVSPESDIRFPDNLPDSLKDLPKYHAITLSQEYYDESVRRIIGMLTHSSSKHKYRKFIIVSVFFILVMWGFIKICSHLWNNNPFMESDTVKSNLTAKVFLPRYDDINREILNIPYFDESNLKEFSYKDSIINDNYIIFPASDFLTATYSSDITVLKGDSLHFHNLPLRIRLYNPKTKTIVIKDAELELDNLRPLFGLTGSIVEKHGKIVFRHEDKTIQPEYELYYSYLSSGESFVDYKQHVTISNSNYELQKFDKYKIVGIIKYNDNKWIFDTQNSENLGNNHGGEVRVEPASNDYYCFTLEVPEMSEHQELKLDNFNRKLVKGEVDDAIFIFISSSRSFESDLRLKITTIENQVIFSDFIKILFVHPSNFINSPF